MRNNHQDSRIGTVLVCVLACGLIAITLGASAVRLAFGSARASKQTLRLRQTQWLLDAGVQRSRLRISNGNFENDLWQLPADVLTDGRGTVRINVEDAENDSVLITVTAEYGPEPANESTIRRSYAYRQSRAQERTSISSQLSLRVAQLVKSFGVAWEAPKVLTTFATEL